LEFGRWNWAYQDDGADGFVVQGAVAVVRGRGEEQIHEVFLAIGVLLRSETLPPLLPAFEVNDLINLLVDGVGDALHLLSCALQCGDEPERGEVVADDEDGVGGEVDVEDVLVPFGVFQVAPSFPVHEQTLVEHHAGDDVGGRVAQLERQVHLVVLLVPDDLDQVVNLLRPPGLVRRQPLLREELRGANHPKVPPHGPIQIRDDVLLVEQNAAEELRRAVGELEVVVHHDLLRHSGGVHHNARGVAHTEVHQVAVLERKRPERLVWQRSQAEQIANYGPRERPGGEALPLPEKLRHQ
jgi:hypothetical protein